MGVNLVLNSLVLFLSHLVTISGQRTCTHLAAKDGEHEFITSPNYPSSYDSRTSKCWIIEAAYPSHKVQLQTVDFQLERESHCVHDFLEIKQDAAEGDLIGRYCSFRGPSITSPGRTLYLRLSTDQTNTERGFKLQYTSVKSATNDGDQQPENEETKSTTDWTSSPNLHLLIIMCVVGAMFTVCLVTVIVAIKSDKTPKRKKRPRMPPSQASSQQELATHIQIEHTTHNETQSSIGTLNLEPSAPPPVHYGNANPSSHLETLPPSYTVAVRDDYDRPYMAFGDDVYGLH